MNLKDKEFILDVLGPKYIKQLASFYGKGDMILGALPAYKHVKFEIKDYIKKYYFGKRDSSLALALRAAGFVGNYQPIVPIAMTPWRSIALNAWKSAYEADIPGAVKVFVGSAKSDEITRKFITLINKMLAETPDLNRSILDNRIWQRSSPHVMVNFSIKDEIRSPIFNSYGKSDVWLKSQINKSIRGFLKIDKHELAQLSKILLLEWTKSGFIQSTAGAMISPMQDSEIELGWPSLYPANGIPMAFCLNKPIDGIMWVGARFDHRVFDGKDASKVYGYIKNGFKD